MCLMLKERIAKMRPHILHQAIYQSYALFCTYITEVALRRRKTDMKKMSIGL